MSPRGTSTLAAHRPAPFARPAKQLALAAAAKSPGRDEAPDLERATPVGTALSLAACVRVAARLAEAARSPSRGRGKAESGRDPRRDGPRRGRPISGRIPRRRRVWAGVNSPRIGGASVFSLDTGEIAGRREQSSFSCRTGRVR